MLGKRNPSLSKPTIVDHFICQQNREKSNDTIDQMGKSNAWNGPRRCLWMLQVMLVYHFSSNKLHEERASRLRKDPWCRSFWRKRTNNCRMARATKRPSTSSMGKRTYSWAFVREIYAWWSKRHNHRRCWLTLFAEKPSRRVYRF